MLRIGLQILAYTLFAVAIGYFSHRPVYSYADPGMAVLKVSFSHATERAEPCVQLTPQEIAELPPNMRQATQCKRERVPLELEVDIDGSTLLDIAAPPAGVWNDGPVSVYRSLDVEPGRYRIGARLRDSGRAQGWDYEMDAAIEMEEGRYYTLTFRAESGGFRLR